MMKHQVVYLPAIGKPYDEYVEEVESGEINFYSYTHTVEVCNEFYAVVEERVEYKDVKLFSLSGNYYKPNKMLAVPRRVKPQFLGIAHVDSKGGYSAVTLNPMDTVRLIAIMESFTSSQMIAGKTYKAGCAVCSYEVRNKEYYLCIDYGKEAFKKSYLDKCNCKIVASVLRTIVHGSDFWFYD